MKVINYKKDDINIDIKFSIEENTIWMNQKEIAILFNRKIPNVSIHIKKIKTFVDENASVVKRYQTVATNGKTYEMSYYNLEIIELIGNKIDPTFTKQFVSWCKEQLSRERNQIMPIQSNIIRFEDDNVMLDVMVSPFDETVYVTQDQFALLFDTDKQNVSYHLSNIFSSCELDEKATVKEILTVQNEGGREVNRLLKYYNLDVAISLGYRINTKRGIAFRKWATKALRELLLKGYVINEERTLVTDENFVNLIHRVDSMDNRIIRLEKEKDINLPKNIYLDEDHEYDAVDFLAKLVSSANKEIILVDAYSDHQTLKVMSYKKENVRMIIITSDKNKMNERKIKEFNEKYMNLEIFISNSFHDRFLVIDKTIYYNLGPSVNYAGNKISIIRKIEDEDGKRFIDDKIEKIIGSATNI